MLHSRRNTLYTAITQLESCIRHPKPERIQYFLPGKGLKIPISHIDILLIDVACIPAEILCRWIISDITCNRIRQFSAGGYSSHKNIRSPVTAFHAALPHIQYCSRIVFFHPLHIDNASDIQNYNST